MAVDIKGPGPNQNSVNQSRTQGVSGERSRAAASEGGGENRNEQVDTVELSAEVQALQNVEARIRDLPEVDEARVESIRNAIAEGRFEVDADRIAARLLSLERALGG